MVDKAIEHQERRTGITANRGTWGVWAIENTYESTGSKGSETNPMAYPVLFYNGNLSKDNNWNEASGLSITAGPTVPIKNIKADNTVIEKEENKNSYSLPRTLQYNFENTRNRLGRDIEETTFLEMDSRANFDLNNSLPKIDDSGAKVSLQLAPSDSTYSPQVIKIQYRDIDTHKEISSEGVLGLRSEKPVLFANDISTVKNKDINGYSFVGSQVVKKDTIDTYNSVRLNQEWTKLNYNKEPLAKVGFQKGISERKVIFNERQQAVVFWYEAYKPTPTIEKKVNKTQVKRQEDVTYSVKVENKGGQADIESPILIDKLPTDMSEPKNIKLDGVQLNKKGQSNSKLPYYEWGNNQLTVTTGKNIKPNIVMNLTYDSTLLRGQSGEEKINTVTLQKSTLYDEKKASAKFRVAGTAKGLVKKYAFKKDSYVNTVNGPPIKVIAPGQEYGYQLNAYNESKVGDSLSGIVFEDTIPKGLSKPTKIKFNNQQVNDDDPAVLIPEKKGNETSNYYTWDEKTRVLKIAIPSGYAIPAGNTGTYHVSYMVKAENVNIGDILTNKVVMKSNSEFEPETSYDVRVVETDKLKVNFELNDPGAKTEDIPPTQIVDYDSKPQKPIPNPRYSEFHHNRIGSSQIRSHKFEGWFVDSKFTKEYDFNTPVTQNITLYAKWTPLPIPIGQKIVIERGTLSKLNSDPAVAESNGYLGKQKKSVKVGDEFTYVTQIRAAKNGPLTVKIFDDELPKEISTPENVKLVLINNSAGSGNKVNIIDVKEKGSAGSSKVYYTIEKKQNGQKNLIVTADNMSIDDQNGVAIAFDTKLEKDNENKLLINKTTFFESNIHDGVDGPMSFLFYKSIKIENKQFTVKFHEQDQFARKPGTDKTIKVIPDQTVSWSEKVTEPESPHFVDSWKTLPPKDFGNPERIPDAMFDGWYEDEKLSKKYDFNTPVTKDTDLYAKWIYHPIVAMKKKVFDRKTLETGETDEHNYPGNQLKIIRKDDDISYMLGIGGAWRPLDTMDTPDKQFKKLEVNYIKEIVPNEITPPTQNTKIELVSMTRKTVNGAKVTNVDSVKRLKQEGQQIGNEPYYRIVDTRGQSDATTDWIIEVFFPDKLTFEQDKGYAIVFDTKVIDHNSDNQIRNNAYMETNIINDENGRLNLYWRQGIDVGFKVEFEPNGGTPKPKDQLVKHGELATEPSGKDAPTHSNRSFEGWYTDEKLTKKYDFSTPVKADIKLYAKWKSPIVDPEDGVTPIDPVDDTGKKIPTNPNDFGLRIQYVSNFNFGEHENGRQEVVANTYSDRAYSTKEKKVKDVPTFVSIIDDSPQGQSKEWTLSVKNNYFTYNRNNETNVLMATKIYLKDLKYADTGKYRPNAVPGAIDISSSAWPVVVSTSGPKPENGSWSLSMGNTNLEDIQYENGIKVKKQVQKSSGAYLEIPEGPYKKTDDEYRTKITWTLTPKI